MSRKIEKFSIANYKDVSDVVFRVRQVAKDIGFDKNKESSIATAVSEIANNTVRHADGGNVNLSVTENGKGLEVFIHDDGPGIKDIDKAMISGYSTKGGLGVGLSGAKRLVDEFDIDSKPEKGTTVTLRMFLWLTTDVYEYDGISLSKPGEVFNGDKYFFKEIGGDSLFAAVIDGGGHGKSAKERSDLALKYLKDHYQEPLEDIIIGCDKYLHKMAKENGSRENGVVMGIALFSKDKFIYTGIGDTKIIVIEPTDQIKPFSRPGIMGFFKLPTVKVQEFDIPESATVIMYSDGIMKRFDRNDLPSEQNIHEISSFIIQNYQRETDDATVIVIKKKKENNMLSPKTTKKKSFMKKVYDKSDAKKRQQTERFKEIRDFLFSVIGNAPVGVMTINMGKVITVSNKQLMRVLGTEMLPKQTINQPLATFLKDLPVLVHAVDNAYKKGRRSFNIAKASYQDRLLSIQARKISDGMLFFFTDVTDVANAQRVLKEQLKKRKAISAIESDFIATASHQLRTPLTGIQWVAERFLKKEKMSEKGREYMKDIRNSVNRLTSLVDLLLNVSRIESGHVGTSPKPLDIINFIEGYVSERSVLTAPKNLSLSFNKHPEKLKVIIDINALRNIIQSIVSNAIEYTPKDGKIDISVEKKTRSFIIKVSDTGIGIPKDEQEHIFDKFTRAENAKLINANGTGLGMYIAKQAVTLLDGKIWLESEENKGTTFYVELPIESKAKSGEKKLL